jgi:hypothetical protein
MKKNEILTIRPANEISIIFLLISIVFFLSAIGVTVSMIRGLLSGKIVSLLLLLLVVFGIWMALHFLIIAITPKIRLFCDYIEITHWKYYLPYDGRDHGLPKLPKSIVTTIRYDELKMFGVFYAKDIKNYLRKKSGLLSNQWMTIMSTPLPLPIKQPKVISELRQVLLFITSDVESTVVDTSPYGQNQIEFLLFELRKHTNIPSSGRVEPKSHVNCYILDILKSIVVILLITVLPISTIWLEGVFNPSHSPSYESIWRTVYVSSFFFANLCLSGIISTSRDSQDLEARRFGMIFKISTFTFYAVFVISFILSIIT